MVRVTIKETKNLEKSAVTELYELNHWSSAKKPDQLYEALLNSDALVTAWHGERLIGLGNALSDGHLVVYYPHLLVHPEYQGSGVGSMIVNQLQRKYRGFHQQILVAEGKAVEFYQKCGFQRAGRTQAMWIFTENE